jgi:hypothetical protein
MKGKSTDKNSGMIWKENRIGMRDEEGWKYRGAERYERRKFTGHRIEERKDESDDIEEDEE